MLRDVGLKSEMDRDAFKGCAQRVAASGTAQAADPGRTPVAERGQLLDTAGALARYFVANVSSLHSNNFYEGVGALAWVPATKVQTSGLQRHQASAFVDLILEDNIACSQKADACMRFCVHMHLSAALGMVWLM